jgi:hypothetical protein
VAQEKGNDQFHDSESEDVEDVYDLYLACDGMLHNGVLDMRKLDELSKEQLEVWNLKRLREIGAHVASGCAQCAAIIRTLNLARGERSPIVNAKHAD